LNQRNNGVYRGRPKLSKLLLCDYRIDFSEPAIRRAVVFKVTIVIRTFIRDSSTVRAASAEVD
jgi:hypothetical protein